MAAVTTAHPPFFHVDSGAMIKVASSSKGLELPPTPPLSDGGRDETAFVSRLEQVADRVGVPSEPPLVYERKMGDTELSYYLPSRADGVNDMYLHLGFRAPGTLLAPARVRAAWAYMRLVHPPLAAHVHMKPWVYDSARFSYSPPRSVAEALLQADASLEFKQETKDALIDAYLNGPRTLNNERLAYLIFGNLPAEKGTSLPSPAVTPSPSDDRTEVFQTFPSDEVQEFDLLICATHFIGDGMALHTFANQFFQLIAGKDESGHEKSTEAIEELLEQEWEKRWGSGKVALDADVLPPSVEEALPEIGGRFKEAASKVDFKNSEAKCIGGHAFPRKKSRIRHTIVPTVALDARKTKAALKRCKENGVSIANAIFSLSSVAWSRIKAEEDAERQKAELPLMMYTALNVRPYLLPSTTANRSYWFTAIGYLNIVLPSFLPSSSESESLRRTFWHRAWSAKKQISQAAKHPLLVSRTHQMARVRGERARKWAKEDDEKDAGIWMPPTPAATPKISSQPQQSEAVGPKEPWILPPAPSTALIGLSMLGNLDSIYAHADYPSLVLHTLTTGSRQRNSASLLFGYTFAGRLWLSLGFDEEGFADGVMQRWWSEVLRGVDEFLVD